MSSTAIEWATHVWNPVTGCDRVSPGCANCYALTYAGRLKAMGQERYQRDGGKSSGPGFGVTLHEDRLGEPARWRKPRPRVFVNSMSDLFHEAVPRDTSTVLWMAMYNAPQHTFQILTKRPERLRGGPTRRCARRAGRRMSSLAEQRVARRVDREPPVRGPRRRCSARSPAAVRFISAEPLLGPLVMDGVAGTPA